ncbi:cobalt transporter [Dapis sp. BLCC M126]|uniref:cobalt transporter n=1 Tax=Dapis sp. BLCC M126 TaxID=3400189 RepID=UPI003CF04684
MKSFSLISILTLSLTLGAPTVVLSHVGHGDEFQATGGIERVRVNPETDSLLGIVVTPIAQNAYNSYAVMVPVTALVDADGKQLVFVKYENFYEPVEVETGATQGEMVEITQGLSIGEQLVTQGSLSLYAESRKTKTAETTATPEAIASPQTNETKAQAQADENVAQKSEELSAQTTQESSGIPIMGILAAVGGGAAVLVGAIAMMGNRSKSTTD